MSFSFKIDQVYEIANISLFQPTQELDLEVIILVSVGKIRSIIVIINPVLLRVDGETHEDTVGVDDCEV